ncbi:hypothetical protein [Terrarubrum flagellatum]|uniref:hypothetical protein n=1 Tax=Terrirubrum flagellatum TaxID=2895980 RepID=UPI00314561AD
MKATSLIAGAAMAAAAAMSTPAPALADDVFTDVLSSIGLIPREREPIEYRERAPLVVPPKTNLPAPQAPSSARNAAWPTDPDVVARQQAAAEREKPFFGSLSNALSDKAASTPRELRNGPRTATNGYSGLPLGAKRDNDAQEMMVRPAMQSKAADDMVRSMNNLTPGQEPDRKALTEPPTGYRKPTEIVRTQQDPIKITDTSDTKEFIQGQRRN